jgi:hypothetical protein
MSVLLERKRMNLANNKIVQELFLIIIIQLSGSRYTTCLKVVGVRQQNATRQVL